MTQRIKGAAKQRAALNTTEDRTLDFVTQHASQTKPVSINFLRKYVKKMNEQINATNPKTGAPIVDGFARALLEKKRDAHFTAIKMFQESYAKGDLEARVAREFCRRHEVHLQDDHAATVSRSPSPTSLQRTSSKQNSEDVLGYTPRPGSVLKRSYGMEQESKREASINHELESILKARRAPTEQP